LTNAELAQIAGVLSAEARVRILAMLKRGARCVGALSARSAITQGAVSQHLRILRDADLVVAQRRGCHMHYRLNEKTLARCREALTQFLSTGLDAPGGASRRDCHNGCHIGETTCVAEKKRAARSRKT